MKRFLLPLLLLSCTNAHSFSLEDIVSMNEGTYAEFIQGYVAATRDGYLFWLVSGESDDTVEALDNAYYVCKRRGAWHVGTIINTISAHLDENPDMKEQAVWMWYRSTYIPLVCPEYLSAFPFNDTEESS